MNNIIFIILGKNNNNNGESDTEDGPWIDYLTSMVISIVFYILLYTYISNVNEFNFEFSTTDDGLCDQIRAGYG